jgi:hypothetical protein
MRSFIRWWFVLLGLLSLKFLRIYHFLFRRISHGASRLQEVLADRMAAVKYGADAFEEGLTHVIRRSVEFPFAVNQEIGLAIEGNRSLRNLYALSSEMGQSVDEEIQKSLQRKTSQDDTHPAPADRFRLVHRVHAANHAPDTSMVWELFQNREALTMEITTLIEQSIERRARPVADSAVPTFKEVDL